MASSWFGVASSAVARRSGQLSGPPTVVLRLGNPSSLTRRSRARARNQVQINWPSSRPFWQRNRPNVLLVRLRGVLRHQQFCARYRSISQHCRHLTHAPECFRRGVISRNTSILVSSSVAIKSGLGSGSPPLGVIPRYSCRPDNFVTALCDCPFGKGESIGYKQGCEALGMRGSTCRWTSWPDRTSYSIDLQRGPAVRASWTSRIAKSPMHPCESCVIRRLG